MAKTKIGSDGWPEDEREALDFEEIADPLVKALRFCFDMKRRNEDKDVPWQGPDIGRSERACCLGARYTVTAEHLAHVLENQGRQADVEIISLAVRLGIEQGRRMFRGSPEYFIQTLKAAQGDHAAGLITAKQFVEVITRRSDDVTD